MSIINTTTQAQTLQNEDLQNEVTLNTFEKQLQDLQNAQVRLMKSIKLHFKQLFLWNKNTGLEGCEHFHQRQGCLTITITNGIRQLFW